MTRNQSRDTIWATHLFILQWSQMITPGVHGCGSRVRGILCCHILVCVHHADIMLYSSSGVHHVFTPVDNLVFILTAGQFITFHLQGPRKTFQSAQEPRGITVDWGTTGRKRVRRFDKQNDLDNKLAGGRGNAESAGELLKCMAATCHEYVFWGRVWSRRTLSGERGGDNPQSGRPVQTQCGVELDEEKG